jgi:hypothetical protein
MKKIGLFVLLSFALHRTFAQTHVVVSPGPNLHVTDTLILNGLTNLFNQVDPSHVSPADSALSASVFTSFKELEEGNTLRVINCYPISTGQFVISISVTGDSAAVLKAILTLVADIHDGRATFATPLAWLTRNWHMQQVGNITYYYQGTFHLSTARAFDRNSSLIARRLGLTPEKFRFYLVDNYQDILRLLGYSYDLRYNGRTRNGHLDESHTIFSVMHNEDFSHDIFHYYSSKFRGDIKRNALVEEGLAYSWGNAYYTDKQGQMITEHKLQDSLRAYLHAHPTASLWQLFSTNPKIFDQLAPEISVRSVISGLLCDEVERQKGLDGIKALIRCGSGEENFFRVIDELIGVNRANFEERVRELLKSGKFGKL